MDFLDINRHGAKKYFPDQGEYRNPYAVGSGEYNEFERGWMRLKMDDGKLVNSLVAKQAFETKIRAVSLSGPEREAKRYKARKG